MNQKTVVVTVTTRKHTHQPAPCVRGTGRGGGRGATNQANNPPVRNRQNYIWSQAIRPPVNNQFTGNKNGVRGETQYFCKSCAVPLHMAKCFKTYHSNKNKI